MPLEQTYQELLASKINPRNPSAVLPVIYNLRKKSFEAYVPPAPKRIIFSPGAVGDNGATATFNVTKNTAEPPVEQTTFARGAAITLSGTATYYLTDGATAYLKAAINITAQIDIGIKNESRNLIGYQQAALASQIADDGTFVFTIPSKITEQLSVGTHYVYIDASSPDNQPVRLSASGTSSDPTNALWFTRTFTITA